MEKKKKLKKRKNKSNGFTMVELLVAMAILALLTVMAFPTLRSIQTANTNKKVDSYGESLISAAKLYTNNYENDMFGDSDVDAFMLTYEELYSKNLIKDINISGMSCKDSSVVIAKNNDSNIYCLNLSCDGEKKIEKEDSKTECDAFKTHKVIYNSNYLTNGIKNVNERILKDSFMVNKEVTIRGRVSSFDVTGYRFAGWNRKKDLSGSYVTGTIPSISSDLNLYAKFCRECDDSNYCKLDTVSNSCSYSPLKACPVGYSYANLNSYKLTCAPNVYLLKYVDSGGVNSPTSIEFNKSFSLTPKKSVTITYDSGSTGITLSTTKETKNYTFKGWTGTSVDSNTALSGTTSANTKWTGSLVNHSYFKNLNPTNNTTVTLTGNWDGPTFILPNLSKVGHTCHFETTINGNVTNYNGGSSYKPSSVTSRTFTAKCSVNTYNCAAGTYLKAGGTSCSTCEAGNYCGGGSFKFNTTTTQGKTSCPAFYTNSAAGAKAKTDCYVNVLTDKYVKTAYDTQFSSCSSGKTNDSTKVYYGGTSGCKDTNVSCNAGYYLKANATSCTKCESGYYCPGGSYPITGTLQGRIPCPNGYSNSAAGSSKNTNCYMNVSGAKHIATAGAQTPINCNIGEYKAAHTVYFNSTSACESCPANYKDGNPTTEKAKCVNSVAIGKYVKTAKSGDVACPSGTGHKPHNVSYGKTSDSCKSLTVDMPLYLFTNKTNHCNNTSTYGSYFLYLNYYKYDCTCKYAKNGSDYSYSSNTHKTSPSESHLAYIVYKKNSNGKSACNNARNYYVTRICDAGTESAGYIGTNTNEPDAFHGMRWYKTSAGKYSGFSGNGWYHGFGYYDDIISSDTSVSNACEKTCKKVLGSTSYKIERVS